MRLFFPLIPRAIFGLGISLSCLGSVRAEEPIQLHEPEASFGEEHYKAAIDKMGRQDWDGAIVEATLYVDQARREAREYALDASAKRKGGNLEAADSAAGKSLENHVCMVKGCYVRAVALLYRQKPSDATKAVADFSTALDVTDSTNAAPDQTPTDTHPASGSLVMPMESEADILDYRGQAKRLSGDVAGAIADFTRAIDLLPGNFRFIYHRAIALNAQGQFSLAGADLHKAMELAPANAEIQLVAGFNAFLAEDFTAAEASLDKAIKLAASPNSYALYVRANVKTCEGRFNEAVNDLDSAIKVAAEGDHWLITAWLLRHCLRERLHLTESEFPEFVARLSSGWEKNLGTYLVHGISEEEFLQAATTDKRADATRQNEAFYYIGMRRLQDGDKEAAFRYFARSTEASPKADFYHQLASAEMKRLKEAK